MSDTFVHLATLADATKELGVIEQHVERAAMQRTILVTQRQHAASQARKQRHVAHGQPPIDALHLGTDEQHVLVQLAHGLSVDAVQPGPIAQQQVAVGQACAGLLRRNATVLVGIGA